MFIDTHCHVNFKDFKDDYLEVINRSKQEKVEMIVVGSELKTSTRAVFLADNYFPGVYSAVGLHPIHLENFLIKNDDNNGKYEFRSQGEIFMEEKYQALIDQSNRVVAVGEIGLDYYHINTSLGKSEAEIKNLQKEVFIKQLNLAQKNNLPVIIHCREAHADLYKILKDFFEQNNFSRDWGVVHCFSGDYDLAQKYFALGLKISFTGLITFVNFWDEIIAKSPLEKIMIETDSPYLSPVPFRGQRNEPVYVKKVAEKIAQIRNMPLKEVEDVIFAVSSDFFNISSIK